MKRIYINGRFLTQSITGVQRYGHEIIKTLDDLITQGEIDSNHQFIILTPRNGIVHYPRLKNIPIHNVGILTSHAWEQLELPFYSQEGLLFCPCNTVPILSTILLRNVIVTVHDISYKYYPTAYNRAFRYTYDIINYFIFKFARLIITVSQAEKESMRHFYKEANPRIEVVKHGTLSDNFLQTVKEKENDKSNLPPNKHPIVMYVGALSKRKNVQGFINAANILLDQKSYENICFMVVGESGKTFENAFVDLPEAILKRINFIGQVNDTEHLVKLYKSATCLVFPSFYESAGLPPIEAMACNCPVIVSAIPALEEYCGDAALYCDPNNTDDIATKIQYLLKNDTLRNAYRSKGLENAKKYNWNESTMHTYSLIKRMIDHAV